MVTSSVNPLIQQIYSAIVKDSINSFISERRSRGLSKCTIKYYSDELRYFQVYLERSGVLRLNEITTQIIRAYLLDLSEHRNQGGVHSAFRTIKAFLNWWEKEVDDDYKNPIHKVKVPAQKIKVKPGICLGDVKKLIDSCTTRQSKRDKAIFLFLLDTGVRASELIALDMSDVNFITGAVAIRHGKGDKARIVFMGSQTRRVVKSYLKTRSDLNNKSPLFASDEDEHLKFSGLRQLVRRCASRAGIETPGLHDFRRSFALQSLRNGMEVITLSRILGHYSVSVTQRYISQNDSDLQLAHEKSSPVDNLF